MLCVHGLGQLVDDRRVLVIDPTDQAIETFCTRQKWADNKVGRHVTEFSAKAVTACWDQSDP